jgi:hypothetical protein
LSALPGLALLLRGSVWGADSFAFWAVSCGQSQYGAMLSSSSGFVWFVENVISCNLFVLAGVMWFLYFFALLGLYFFGKRFFAHQAWRFPLYVAALTPLFFIEAMRFENDFFGWALAFIALGLFSLVFGWKDWKIVLLACIIACFSLNIWIPSVFVLLLAVFLMPLDKRVVFGLFGIGLIGLIVFKLEYFTNSFANLFNSKLISEEIPLVGLVFILHVLHFYKNIPLKLKLYGWLLLFFGAVKSKYMFLAVPLLLMGLMNKEDSEPLQVRGYKIPVLLIVLFLSVGWFVMAQNMYPTSKDISEMNQAINLAKLNGVPLYNDWGDGWTFVSLGYDTNYKISFPNPDWNNLQRPFVGWSKIDLLDCNKVTKRIQYCD